MNSNYYLEDDSKLFKRYCPKSNTNEEFTMVKLLVI